MDLSAALNAHIRSLYGSLGIDHHETVAWVGALSRDLRQAVPSYVGLQMVLVEHGHPVTLTKFDADARSADIRSSVRLPLRPLGVVDADPSSIITFFAVTPGAFVDLAADVAFALRIPIKGPSDAVSEADGYHDAIILDGLIQPSTVESGLVGATELSTINRAIGLLIGGGHSPSEARAELERRAAVAGISVVAGATQLIRPDTAGN